MNENDYVEVDLYVCGVYRGRRKVGRNSIVGKLMELDFGPAMDKLVEMKEDIEQIGAAVSIQTNSNQV